MPSSSDLLYVFHIQESFAASAFYCVCGHKNLSFSFFICHRLFSSCSIIYWRDVWKKGEETWSASALLVSPIGNIFSVNGTKYHRLPIKVSNMGIPTLHTEMSILIQLHPFSTRATFTKINPLIKNTTYKRFNCLLHFLISPLGNNCPPFSLCSP